MTKLISGSITLVVGHRTIIHKTVSRMRWHHCCVSLNYVRLPLKTMANFSEDSRLEGGAA